jgi:hypothetical protein
LTVVFKRQVRKRKLVQTETSRKRIKTSGEGQQDGGGRSQGQGKDVDWQEEVGSKGSSFHKMAPKGVLK